MSSEGLSYAAAGVDIEAYERALERVKPLIAATHGKEVVEGVGPFAGLYALPGGGHLAASADGVGTKVKVAIAASSHRGIGVDIVNHCVNDIATARARPLFFLDYFATGRLDPDVFTQLVEGMTAACRAAGCALLGGETAEMPGVYALGDYDLAGFIVGGVLGNLPRCLPDGLAARLERKAWRVPPIFELIRKQGRIADDEMYGTFNMGIGMILVVDRRDVPEGGMVIGEVVRQAGPDRVVFR